MRVTASGGEADKHGQASRSQSQRSRARHIACEHGKQRRDDSRGPAGGACLRNVIELRERRGKVAAGQPFAPGLPSAILARAAVRMMSYMLNMAAPVSTERIRGKSGAPCQRGRPVAGTLRRQISAVAAFLVAQTQWVRSLTERGEIPERLRCADRA